MSNVSLARAIRVRDETPRSVDAFIELTPVGSVCWMPGSFTAANARLANVDQIWPYRLPQPRRSRPDGADPSRERSSGCPQREHH